MASKAHGPISKKSGPMADLIILGTHGRRGVQRLLLGSDAEQVARIAPVPVMLVRDTLGHAISRTGEQEVIKNNAFHTPTDE